MKIHNALILTNPSTIIEMGVDEQPNFTGNRIFSEDEYCLRASLPWIRGRAPGIVHRTIAEDEAEERRKDVARLRASHDRLLEAGKPFINILEIPKDREIRALKAAIAAAEELEP